MNLNESIVEDTALEWFGEQTRYARTLTPALSQGERETVGHGPHLAPSEPAAERDSFSEVVLVGRLREAIRRLNFSIWDLASGETYRKCQGTTKMKLISI